VNSEGVRSGRVEEWKSEVEEWKSEVGKLNSLFLPSESRIAPIAEFLFKLITANC
jgi:hypothetical protein